MLTLVLVSRVIVNIWFCDRVERESDFRFQTMRACMRECLEEIRMFVDADRNGLKPDILLLKEVYYPFVPVLELPLQYVRFQPIRIRCES